jgi:hypothetical protein
LGRILQTYVTEYGRNAASHLRALLKHHASSHCDYISGSLPADNNGTRDTHQIAGLLSGLDHDVSSDLDLIGVPFGNDNSRKQHGNGQRTQD